MALDFPTNPAVGDTVTMSNGVKYEYDGDKWVIYGADTLTTNVDIWTRRPNGDIEQVYPGDDLKIIDANDVETVRITGDGDVTLKNLRVDTLTVLP